MNELTGGIVSENALLKQLQGMAREAEQRGGLAYSIPPSQGYAVREPTAAAYASPEENDDLFVRPPGEYVRENKDVIQSATFVELLEMGTEQGYATSTDIHNDYIAALMDEAQVDFAQKKKEWLHELSGKGRTAFDATQEVVLHVAADVKKNRFAITNDDGEPIWSGPFVEEDEPLLKKDPCEAAAAMAAVYAVKQVKNLVPDEKIRIMMKTTAGWLRGYNDPITPLPVGKELVKTLGKLVNESGMLLQVWAEDRMSSPAQRVIDKSQSVPFCEGKQNLVFNQIAVLELESEPPEYDLARQSTR